MTVKERIVRTDAFDGLIPGAQLNDPEEVARYYEELAMYEESINNNKAGEALRTCGDMECAELGALIMNYAESDACKLGTFTNDDEKQCVICGAFVMSRLLQDESYDIISSDISKEAYYNTSGVMDETGKEAYENDINDRTAAIVDMATILISETINDDECIMTFRTAGDEDPEMPDEDASPIDYDAMTDHDLLVTMVKDLKAIKTIEFEILKALATSR